MGETFSKLHSKSPQNKLKSSHQPPATPADNKLDDSMNKPRPTETIEERELVIGSKASTCDVNSHPVANEEDSPAHQPTPQSLGDVEMSSKSPQKEAAASSARLAAGPSSDSSVAEFRSTTSEKRAISSRMISNDRSLIQRKLNLIVERENTRHALQNSNASGEDYLNHLLACGAGFHISVNQQTIRRLSVESKKSLSRQSNL